MEMESIRIRFEERGTKKARLNGSVLKLRTIGTESEDFETRGTISEIEELVGQYKKALKELTFNSKPIITNLTIIAGENLHAAMEVADTICMHILEVPSDQKLPSLYLLDSIAKNIGADYIKYFGTRLPEVFCKAYMQVDPSTHPGMRHLFGTWKGVFPAQPLQIIAKELVLPLAANGSSFGSPSIHVNPKYLEARQRLQQSIQTTQSSQRHAPDGFIRDKNIFAACGNNDQHSNHSSQSSLEIGKVKERVIDKPWYGANNLEEKFSTSTNGLDIKYLATAEKPCVQKNCVYGRTGSGIDESWEISDEEVYMWDDSNPSGHLLVGISQRRRWIPDEYSRSVFQFDLGLANRLWKPESMDAAGSRIDIETSPDALFTERKDQAPFRNGQSPSWTNGPHSVKRKPILSHMSLSHIGTSSFGTPIPSHMGPSQIGTSKFGFSLNPELVPSVSVGKKRPLASDYMAEQDYPQSQLPRRPEITNSHFSSANTRSQISLDSRSLYLQDAVIVNSPKYPPQILQTSGSIVHSVPPRHHILLAEISSQYHQSPLPKLEARNSSSTVEFLSNQSSRKSEVDSTIKKNEVVAKKSVNGIISSLSMRYHPLSSGPLKDPRLTARTSKKQSSHALLSTPFPLSETKAEPPPLPSGPPPFSQASDSGSKPVSGLLSTLVAKGLINASKTKSTASSMQLITQPLNPNAVTVSPSPVSLSSISITSNKKVSSKTNKPSMSTSTLNGKVSLEINGPSKSTWNKNVSQDTNQPSKSVAKCSTEIVEPVIGLEFKPDLIRRSHPSVVKELHVDLPHGCDICGLRVNIQETDERHLKWHALRNSQEKISRKWYAHKDNWVAGKDMISADDMITGEPEEREVMVPVDESQCACVLCGEIFDDVYCHNTGEWMFKGAVYLSVPLGDLMIETSSHSDFKGPIVHANCISQNAPKDLGFPAE